MPREYSPWTRNSSSSAYIWARAEFLISPESSSDARARSSVIETAALQSVYATQFLSVSSDSGRDTWYPAGTARLAPSLPSGRIAHPSGSGSAKGSAGTRNAPTASATTAPPAPSQAIRPGHRRRADGGATCADGTGGGATREGGAGGPVGRGCCAGGRTASVSSSRTRRADGRRAGSLRSSPSMASASGPRAAEGGAGVASRTDWRAAGVLPRRNGETPSVAVYSSTPRDHRSLAGPGSCPDTRSGATYSGEPTKPPVSVSRVSPPIRAMPKSVRTTRPCRPGSTLSGFTSRCRTPAACAASSAPSTSRPIRAASRASRVPSSSTSPSVRPCSSSSTSQGRPSTTATSYTLTTAGWSRRAAARASRRMRSQALARSRSGRWSGIRGSLTATSRPTVSSRARHPVPMPPRPSLPVSR